MELDHVPKFLTVARAPARIRIEHHVALRGHPLEFVLENKTVGRVRAAVNIQDERIFFLRIESRRFLQPRLNVLSIEALVTDLFRLGQIELAE